MLAGELREWNQPRTIHGSNYSHIHAIVGGQDVWLVPLRLIAIVV